MAPRPQRQLTGGPSDRHGVRRLGNGLALLDPTVPGRPRWRISPDSGEKPWGAGHDLTRAWSDAGTEVSGGHVPPPGLREFIHSAARRALFSYADDA